MDGIRQPLEDFIRGVMLPSEFYCPFACKVTAQNSDGTVDVETDDARVGSFSSVPVKWGSPGCVATMSSGARATVRFQNGDPRRPFVSAFDVSSVTELRLGATSARGNEVTEKSVLGTTYRNGESQVNSKEQAAFTANSNAMTALSTLVGSLSAVGALLPPPAAAALAAAITATTPLLGANASASGQAASQLGSFEASASSYLSNVVKLR